MKRKTKLSLIAVALSASALSAYAASGALANDSLAVAEATIPLSQAVTIAEQHVQGKASKAEFEETRNGLAYDVEVIKGNTAFDVKVDAHKGTVLASAEDKADRDDDHDERD